jgi:capsid assembly protease
MTMNNNNHYIIRQALYGQPWAIEESWLHKIIAIAEANFNEDKFQEKIAESYALDLKTFQERKPLLGKQGEEKEIERMGNFAIVRLNGPIFRHANLLTRLSGATSLDKFNQDFKDALEDKETTNVLTIVDSPGGEVTGLVESSNLIYNASKTCFAFVQDMACSAAYWLASQHEIVFSQEGAPLGSIGVIMQTEQDDRALKNAGIDVLTLRSSELKGGGINNVSDITQNQLKNAMRIMSDITDTFHEHVMRNRSDKIKDTSEAFNGSYWSRGKDHLRLGLSDEVTTLDAIIKAYD